MDRAIKGDSGAAVKPRHGSGINDGSGANAVVKESRRVVSAIEVRHEPTSAGLVRRRIGADLAERGIEPDSINEVVLVISELVGNAVRHTPMAAADPLAVRWEVDPDGVLVEVTDASTEPPRPRTPGTDEPSGRGLQIVAAMADDWGVVPLRSGKRVWAHVPVHRVASVS